MTPMTRYTWPAMTAHWTIAALILVALPLGWYLHDLPLSPTKLRLYSYHKWIGVTVLLLFVPRLLIRLRYPPPAHLPAPAWQQRIAALTHGALYLLIAAVPLSGWLMSSAKGFPVVYLGVLPLPDLVSKDPALGDWLKAAHETLSFALLGLILLHVAAALKHQLIERDGTLWRMLPLGKLRSAQAEKAQFGRK